MCIADKLSGVTMPLFEVVRDVVSTVSRSTKRLRSPACLLMNWINLMRPPLRPKGTLSSSSLRDDDSMALFMEMLPSLLFVRIQTARSLVGRKSLVVVRGSRSPSLYLISFALTWESFHFMKGFSVFNVLVALLKEGQGNDDSKKVSCLESFDMAEVDAGTRGSQECRFGLQRPVGSDSCSGCGRAQIEVLDSSMSKATEVRKEQHLESVMQTIARPRSC